MLEHRGEFDPGLEVKKLLEKLMGQDRLDQCNTAQRLEEENRKCFPTLRRE